MAKHKQTEIILKVSKPTKKEYDSLKYGKEWRKAVRATTKEYRKHFEKHKWDISSNQVLSDVINRFCGTWFTHLSDLVIREMCHKCKVSWGYRDEGSFTTKSNFKGRKLAGFVYTRQKSKHNRKKK